MFCNSPVPATVQMGICNFFNIHPQAPLLYFFKILTRIPGCKKEFFYAMQVQVLLLKKDYFVFSLSI